MATELKPGGDWLENMLRQERPYIDDAGFSQRVVAALPAPQASHEWLHGAIILAAAVFSCLLALFILPAGQFLSHVFVAASLVQLTPLGLAIVASGIVGGFWIALTINDRDAVAP